MGDFGNKFRKAREAKELSFDDVSNVIKISSRMLRAIEAEDFDQLPGGVFNKGFIRSYAKQLGLDPEEAVTEYLDQMHQAQLTAQAAWQPPSVEETRPAKSKTVKSAGSARSTVKSQTPVEVQELPDLHLPREQDLRSGKKGRIGGLSAEFPWKLVALAGVIVILGTVLWTRHSHQQPPATATSATSAQPQPTSQVPSPPVNPGIPSAVVPNSGSPNTSTAGQQESPAPSAASSAPDLPEEKGDVTIRNFGKPLPKSTDKSTEKLSGSLMLTVRASENSWISVTADGQPLTEETLIAPAHTTFRASQNFIVKVGNAAAVTFLWNGQEIRPQGAEGEVKTIVFDSNGMRVASPSQAPSSTAPTASSPVPER
jgi:cytoskeletal protein RodZ